MIYNCNCNNYNDNCNYNDNNYTDYTLIKYFVDKIDE